MNKNKYKGGLGEKLAALWKNASAGKKVYAFLWVLTGILLVIVVAMFVAYKSPSDSQANLVAGMALVFAISIVVSVFTTVLVSVKEQKRKRGVQNDRN